MKLLFTGGGGTASEPLYALLQQHEVHFADANPCAKPPSIPSDRWHVIPAAHRPSGLNNIDFVPALMRLCDGLSVDYLIPGVDEELPALAWRCPDDMRVIQPSLGFVLLHLDKLASMRTLAERGVPVPSTQRLVPKKNQTAAMRFPSVLKPRAGRGSRHVAVVHSVDEALAHVTLSGVSRMDYLVQEHLEGQEYTVTMVANRAKQLRAIVPVRVESKRGITTHGVTDGNQHVIDYCQRIHEADPFSGIVNVQCMHGEYGVKAFEINPRISTTACMAIAAGVDVIGLLGDQGDGLVPFEQGISLRRYWNTVIA